jgi:hypothetical protein
MKQEKEQFLLPCGKNELILSKVSQIARNRENDQ